MGSKLIIIPANEYVVYYRSHVLSLHINKLRDVVADHARDINGVVNGQQGEKNVWGIVKRNPSKNLQQRVNKTITHMDNAAQLIANNKPLSAEQSWAKEKAVVMIHIFDDACKKLRELAKAGAVKNERAEELVQLFEGYKTSLFSGVKALPMVLLGVAVGFILLHQSVSPHNPPPSA